MIRLETERLIIRNFIVTDWIDLAELAMKYEATELAKYDQGPWPSNLDEYKGIVEEFAKGDNILAVVLKESNKLIGLIFKGDQGIGKYEFGFNFNSDYHGQGYAIESCKTVLDFIFIELNADLVTAGTAKVNKSSNNLLKRLGFEFVGENNISFRKDEDGNPIEFVGVDYSLSRN